MAARASDAHANAPSSTKPMAQRMLPAFIENPNFITLLFSLRFVSPLCALLVTSSAACWLR
jgi:hypothetical protein